MTLQMKMLSELSRLGYRILVGSEVQSTIADYLLKDTDEVRMFIEQLNPFSHIERLLLEASLSK